MSLARRMLLVGILLTLVVTAANPPTYITAGSIRCGATRRGAEQVQVWCWSGLAYSATTAKSNAIFQVASGYSVLETYNYSTDIGQNRTDIAIDSANSLKITSAASPFTAGSVGLFLDVTASVGFTSQIVKIVSVTGGVATCDLSVGVLGATGGTGQLFSHDILTWQFSLSPEGVMAYTVTGNSSPVQAGTL